MIPTLTTPRLRVRPARYDDVDRIVELASAREVAATTLNLPHPYPRDAGLAWVSTHAELANSGRAVICAIATEAKDDVVGVIGLTVESAHDRAELGYWVGLPYWGRGYTTEAARAFVEWGFTDLGLKRIWAGAFASNRASTRVMEKVGMTREGLQRGHIQKWGEPVDHVLYGMLASDPRPQEPGAANAGAE